ncbi:MAG: hypothetical protein ACPGN3_12665 [Opitutales bacterium]
MNTYYPKLSHFYLIAIASAIFALVGATASGQTVTFGADSWLEQGINNNEDSQEVAVITENGVTFTLTIEVDTGANVKVNNSGNLTNGGGSLWGNDNDPFTFSIEASGPTLREFSFANIVIPRLGNSGREVTFSDSSGSTAFAGAETVTAEDIYTGSLVPLSVENANTWTLTVANTGADGSSDLLGIESVSFDYVIEPNAVVTLFAESSTFVDGTAFVSVEFDRPVSGLDEDSFDITHANVMAMIGEDGDTRYTLLLEPTGEIGDSISISLLAGQTTPINNESNTIDIAIVDSSGVLTFGDGSWLDQGVGNNLSAQEIATIAENGMTFSLTVEVLSGAKVKVNSSGHLTNGGGSLWGNDNDPFTFSLDASGLPLRELSFSSIEIIRLGNAGRQVTFSDDSGSTDFSGAETVSVDDIYTGTMIPLSVENTDTWSLTVANTGTNGTADLLGIAALSINYEIETSPIVDLTAPSSVIVERDVLVDVTFNQPVFGLSADAFDVLNASVREVSGEEGSMSYSLLLTATGDIGESIQVALGGGETTPSNLPSNVASIEIIDTTSITPQGYLGFPNAALLGHSFFYPTAHVFEPMARFCGYENQYNTWVEQNPGESGGAGAVWEEYLLNEGQTYPDTITFGEGENQVTLKNNKLVEHLTQGGVELLGMTYFPSSELLPEGSPSQILESLPDILAILDDPETFISDELALITQDYHNWVDLTLTYSSADLRKVFVMTPWSPWVGGYIDTSELSLLEQIALTIALGGRSFEGIVRELQDISNEVVRGVVSNLRSQERFEHLEIVVVPAGEGLMQIWDRMDDIEEITEVAGDRANSVYAPDNLHAGKMVSEMVHLLWMTCIFPELDITKFNAVGKEALQGVGRNENTNRELFSEWTGVNILELAQQIADDEPYSVDTRNAPLPAKIDHAPAYEWTDTSDIQVDAIFANDVSVITAQLDAWDPDGELADVQLSFGSTGASLTSVPRDGNGNSGQAYFEATWEDPVPGVSPVSVILTSSSDAGIAYEFVTEIAVLEADDMAAWQLTFFDADEDDQLSLAELKLADRGNDFEGDGLTNFAEYALGNDPTHAFNSRSIVPTTVSESGDDYPGMSYTRRMNASQLTYAVSTSFDLLHWAPAIRADGDVIPNTFTQISVSEDDSDGTETVELRYNQSLDDISGKKLFFRVEVSE